MGKGDDRRPARVSPEEYARRWEEAFGNKAHKARVDAVQGPECGKEIAPGPESEETDGTLD